MSEVSRDVPPEDVPMWIVKEREPDEHLREDAGLPPGDPDRAYWEHLRVDVGLVGIGEDLNQQQERDGKGLINKVKDKLRRGE